MTIFCEQCGRQLHPDNLFCPFCGANAPSATRKGNYQSVIIEHPLYCVACSYPNDPNSLYCTHCGHYFFSQPGDTIDGQSVKKYCPSCGAENSFGALVCYNCSFSFEQWFSQQGEAARIYGLSSPCRLKETMNGVSYRFINDTQITLGRSGTITIPCSFISASHTGIDFERFILLDLGSTNGTFVNRKPDRISSIPLSLVSEFNLGGFFTFKIEQLAHLIYFRLTAILEEKECCLVGNPEEFKKLRSTYIIYTGSDEDLYVGKSDGSLTLHPIAEEQYWKFSIINGFLYFTDIANRIEKKLVIREGMNLPKNWKVVED